MQALVSVNLVVFFALNVHTSILSVSEVILSTFLEFLLTLMVVKTPVVVFLLLGSRLSYPCNGCCAI